MKEIERRIRGLVLEMVGIVSFLICSLFVWNNFDYSKEAQIAYAYQDYNNMINTVITKNINILFPTDDESSNYINGVHFMISNSNNTSKTYNLYFKYDKKNSSLSEEYIKLNYEGKIYKLNELTKVTENDVEYFKITTDKISKRSKEEKEIKIFLDIDTPSEEQTKLLSFNIYAQDK